MSIFRKWYWRGAVAITVGCVALLVPYAAQNSLYFGRLTLRGGGAYAKGSVGFRIAEYIGTNMVAICLFFGLPIALASVLVYATLTKKYGESAFECETRCRKCGYILRGISEPRCPECGERI